MSTNSLACGTSWWIHASGPTRIATIVAVPASTALPEQDFVAGGLGHGVGFAGQRRLVDLEAVDATTRPSTGT